jgi:hypothetical protein
MLSIKRLPRDSAKAECAVADIRRPYWANTYGETPSATGHRFLFGFVSCDAVVSGELAHSCGSETRPHEVQVCIPKVGNDATAYHLLVSRIGVGERDLLRVTPEPIAPEIKVPAAVSPGASLARAPSKPPQVKIAYSVPEAAEAVSLSVSGMWEQLRTGAIKGRKMGGRTIILATELNEYLAGLPYWKGD